MANTTLRAKMAHMDNMTLAEALKKTHDVELEDGDKVEFEHNYCEHTLVDVIVTDINTGEKHTFKAFNTRFGSFPY